jgi:hypothetical protein
LLVFNLPFVRLIALSNGLSHGADPVDEELIDPALSDSCRRDVKQYLESWLH